MKVFIMVIISLSLIDCMVLGWDNISFQFPSPWPWKTTLDIGIIQKSWTLKWIQYSDEFCVASIRKGICSTCEKNREMNIWQTKGNHGKKIAVYYQILFSPELLVLLQFSSIVAGHVTTFQPKECRCKWSVSLPYLVHKTLWHNPPCSFTSFDRSFDRWMI